MIDPNYAKLAYENYLPKSGNPGGGWVRGIGLSVDWQDGPRYETSSRGALVEDLLEAVIQRLEFYQMSKFNCAENQGAILMCKGALDFLHSRTENRKARGVEGKHEL